MYDSRQWKALRRHVLATEPCCRFCLALGLRTRATVVDHIEPHHGRAALFFKRENLQPLCVHHHNGLKQSIEKRKRHAGYDINGYPRDPNHPSYRRPRVG